MGEPLYVRIADPATLAAASDALHDAPFDGNDIRYDPTTQNFDMILRREVSGRLAPTRFRNVCVEVEEPEQRWAKCRLTFRQVEDADIRINVRRGAELIDLEYDSGTDTVTVDAGGAVDIVLRVTELDGELADI